MLLWVWQKQSLYGAVCCFFKSFSTIVPLATCWFQMKSSWAVCDSILLSLCHEGSWSRCWISNLLKYSWRSCMTCRYLSVWFSVTSAKQVLWSKSLPWLYKELKESHWFLAPHFLWRRLLEKSVNYARNCHLCGHVCTGHIDFTADNFWWLWQMRCKYPGQDPAVKLLVHEDVFCFDAWI